jgi:hypothetical protein
MKLGIFLEQNAVFGGQMLFFLAFGDFRVMSSALATLGASGSNDQNFVFLDLGAFPQFWIMSGGRGHHESIRVK